MNIVICSSGGDMKRAIITVVLALTVAAMPARTAADLYASVHNEYLADLLVLQKLLNQSLLNRVCASV